MSHEISNIDQQEGIEQAWHGLTKVREVITLAGCWLAKWDVKKQPLFMLSNEQDENGSFKTIATEYCQLVATDDAKIRIGAPVHCETYQPVTNEAFLALVGEALLSIEGAKVASVGSVCERGRVFVSVKLKQLEAFEAAGREFKPYLNFLNSHDQSSAFIVNTSNTCTVCNNTFRANLHADGKETGIRVKLKHTKNIAQRIDNISEVIDGFLGAQAQFRAIMDGFAAQPIDRKDVRPLFTGFLFGKLPDVSRMESKQAKAALELSTRKVNQIDRLTELFSNGAGNKGRDLSDVFSAVTDYYSHESSGNVEASKQFVASEFGSGQQAKERAFDLLQKPEEIRKLVQTGNAVLAVN